MFNITLKTVRRLLLLLLAGCAINILIAWYAAFRFPPGSLAGISGSEPDPGAATLWERFRQDDWPEHPDEMTRIQISKFTSITGYAKRRHLYYATEAQYGYPCHSLSCYIWGSTARGRNYVDTIPKIRNTKFVRIDSSRLFPIHPLWPGFLINNILYSLVVYLIIVYTVYWRKEIRLVRLRCPGCAYPIIEWKLCPECGFNLATVRHSVRRKFWSRKIETQVAEDGIKAHLAAEKRYRSQKYLSLFAAHTGLTGVCILPVLADPYPNPFMITLAAIMLVAFCVAFPFWLKFLKQRRHDADSTQKSRQRK